MLHVLNPGSGSKLQALVYAANPGWWRELASDDEDVAAAPLAAAPSGSATAAQQPPAGRPAAHLNGSAGAVAGTAAGQNGRSLKSRLAKSFKKLLP